MNLTMRAVEIYNFIDNERIWLRRAATSFDQDKYSRLVQYSVDRIQFGLTNQFSLKVNDVGIQVSGQRANVEINIQIVWGDPPLDILRQWDLIGRPKAQA